jgi:cation diffusion facilitator family transporter
MMRQRAPIALRRNTDVQQAASFESQDLSGPGRPLRAISISLALALLLLACKFVAYTLTGSTAILSDALESVVNVVAAGFALFSVIVAARPADRGHPYGHGKVEYFSAAVEGGLILAAAGYIVVEAIRELMRGPDLQRLGWGMVLMAGTAAINTGLGVYLLRIGRRTRSLTLEADGRHVLTDVATTLGVVIGLLLVRFTGVLALDPIVALLVAANIVRTGYGLMRRAVAGLMDEADPETLGDIRRGLLAHHDPAAIEIHQLRAWRAGRAVYADFHVLLPHWFDLQRSHDLGNALRDAALSSFDGIGDAVVHLDPCSEVYCVHCRLEICTVRQAPYGGPLDQSIAAMTGEPLKLRTGQTS